MKRLYCLLLALVSLFTYAQTPESTWFRNNYTKKEQYIPMRDGTRLFTSIYLPNANTEKHPILITRTAVCAISGHY